MELQQLEIQNFRSIKDQWEKNAIEFEGLDCLVGENNVGKTNIISSVKYLLEEDDKRRDDELYWKKDNSLTVKVRGYFKIYEEDLERVQDEKKERKSETYFLMKMNLKTILGSVKSRTLRKTVVGHHSN